MSITVQPYTPRVEFSEFIGKSQPWGLIVKNALLGRLENWRDKILAVGAIYHVAQAFFFFIGGYWMISFISFATGLLLAKTRKDLRDFADLRKETLDYKGQNHQHRELNLQQSKENQKLAESNQRLAENIEIMNQNLEVFASEVDLLTEERVQLGETNAALAYNNSIFSEMLHTLGGTVSDMKSVLRSGKHINQEMREKALECFDRYDRQIETLQDAVTAMKEENVEALRRFKDVASQLKEMNAEGLRIFQDANTKLIQTKTELDLTTQQLTQVKKELADATVELRKAIKRNDESSVKLSKQVHQTVTGGRFSGLFSRSSSTAVAVN